MKKRQALKDELRVKLNKEKEKREQQKPVQPPPRYDGVFLEGVKWLSTLTGRTTPADLRR